MVDVLFFPIGIVAEQARPAGHIDSVIDDKQLFRTFELACEFFLVVLEVEAAEAVLCEDENVLVSESAQCDYLFSDRQVVRLIVAAN